MTTIPIPCSVLVLTHNAGKTISACLEGLREFAQVIVLDGYSTDDSRSIASTFSNVAIHDQPREFLEPSGRIRDFASVRNAGLMLANQPWFLYVDSDETLTPEFLASIRDVLASGKHDAYTAFRRFVINGEKIERAAAYPALHVRLARRERIINFVKPIHERLDLVPGATVGHLAGDLLIPLSPPSELWPKYRRYLALEVERAARLPFGQWLYWVLLWNVRSFFGFALRLIALSVTPGRGKRLPLQYELQFLAYPLLLIVESSPLHRLPLGQFVTYLFTGGTATAINVGLYTLLLWLDVWYVGASVMSEVIGFISAFLLHKYVAFRQHSKFASHFFKYCMLGLWNLFASTVLLWGFVDGLGVDELIAKLLVIACMVAWNFILYKFVIYV